MRKFLLAAVLLGGATGFAQAADPVMPPPVFEEPAHDWSGFYAGVFAGYAVGTVDVDFRQDLGPAYNAVLEAWNYPASGFLAGLTVGGNFQSGMFVLGVEGEVGYLGLTGSAISPVAFNPQQDTVASVGGGLYALLAGRVGIAVDTVLLYAKAGIVGANLSLGVVDTNPIGLTINASRTGFVPGVAAGVGAEIAVTEDISIKAEYLWLGFQTQTIGGVASNGTTFTWDHIVSAHTAKVGVNFSF